LQTGGDPPYGGDIRIGDLTGNGSADFVAHRSAEDGLKPCFLAAFTVEGETLWRFGEGGEQPARPGPVTVHDIDGDGRAEVICFFLDSRADPCPSSLCSVLVQVRDGASGEVLKQATPNEIRSRSGSGSNWVHQRLLVANLRGGPVGRDIVIKLGERVVALDENLNVLWTYPIRWNDYGRCSAYIPAVGDIDGDGCDEVTGGYYLLDHDGRPLWEKQIAPHMDSVAVAEWDRGAVRVIASGGGHVLDEKGNVILGLGEDVVPHGQEVRVARFTAEARGPQMTIRYNGHHPDVMLVDNDGRILKRFRVNPSPNNTGMEAVFWNGPDSPALLYNGGALWDGSGRRFADLPGLPPPVGDARMGWYHCIPANVCGDKREELVLFNPWSDFVSIYTPFPLDETAFTGYHATPRQYNARMMD